MGKPEPPRLQATDQHSHAGALGSLSHCPCPPGTMTGQAHRERKWQLVNPTQPAPAPSWLPNGLSSPEHRETADTEWAAPRPHSPGFHREGPPGDPQVSAGGMGGSTGFDVIRGLAPSPVPALLPFVSGRSR